MERPSKMMLSAWSEALSFPADEQSFEMVMNAINAVRSRRSEMNVPPSRKAHLIIATEKKAAFEAGVSYWIWIYTYSSI